LNINLWIVVGIGLSPYLRTDVDVMKCFVEKCSVGWLDAGCKLLVAESL